MVAYRAALACAVVFGSLALAGCEQGNDPGGPAPIVPPNYPKSSDEAKNLSTTAPDPSKPAPKGPVTAPPAAK